MKKIQWDNYIGYRAFCKGKKLVIIEQPWTTKKLKRIPGTSMSEVVAIEVVYDSYVVQVDDEFVYASNTNFYIKKFKKADVLFYKHKPKV